MRCTVDSERLRALIKARYLLKDFAKKAQVNLSTLGRALTFGRADIKTAQKISAALGVALEEFAVPDELKKPKRLRFVVDTDKLLKLAEATGKTAISLSRLAGLAPPTFGDVLRSGIANLKTLKKISALLGVEVEELIDKDAGPPPNGHTGKKLVKAIPCQIDQVRLLELVMASDKTCSRMGKEMELHHGTLSQILLRGTANLGSVEKMSAYFGIPKEELIVEIKARSTPKADSAKRQDAG